ncbi:MAG: ankyrin repeat domain-containing protein [Bradyrhizobium sp.]|uniref:ankyrin repeat domain-containing protein n=1 Tax=Bradyrhizobium sp. TaxID=376 RepID=UPI001DF971FC|nr:ankyrin repeat domain-containing protein [Bradyrhizobium sp.]MBV9561478.1 ankyrin repeat domain-containing protein [Bradyrhizobium sp.]
MSQALPEHPDLAWLKKAAKKRLAQLRAVKPETRLYEAQLAVANDHGFPSWRALKAHLDGLSPDLYRDDRVFDAARAGDVETLRRAFALGFDPSTPDRDGRTIHQIAKELRHEAIELLARDAQGGRGARPEAERQALQDIASAAQSGNVAALRAGLDAHPELIDALAGRGFEKAAALHLAALHNRHDAIRLLIERGADLDRRDFPDNAAPLHFAAAHGDLETIRLLVDAGADIEGKGDDYAVGVLGWATCFKEVREEVASHLLDHGATLNVWTAIALDRAEELRAMIVQDPTLLAARMSRNQHRRSALHHAAAKNRLTMVQLLLALGADPNATDATGATALTTASQEHADGRIVSALLAGGTKLDFLTALNTGRYDEAEAMLRENPARIGPDGADTIALHLAVSRKNLAVIRWLLAHGAAVDAKRPIWDCNHTALHMTVESGAIDIARLLLDAGASPNIRDDKYDATALGWAEYFGRDDFVALLHGKGGEEDGNR